MLTKSNKPNPTRIAVIVPAPGNMRPVDIKIDTNKAIVPPPIKRTNLLRKHFFIHSAFGMYALLFH